jgi:hypothetical protein
MSVTKIYSFWLNIECSWVLCIFSSPKVPGNEHYPWSFDCDLIQVTRVGWSCLAQSTAGASGDWSIGNRAGSAHCGDAGAYASGHGDSLMDNSLWIIGASWSIFHYLSSNVTSSQLPQIYWRNVARWLPSWGRRRRRPGHGRHGGHALVQICALSTIVSIMHFATWFDAYNIYSICTFKYIDKRDTYVDQSYFILISSRGTTEARRESCGGTHLKFW